MQWKIVTKQQQQTAQWAGGTTTQLYIHPQNAVYGDRQFQFRVSSAVVELESSEFTALPGFQRHIMPLEGEMKLVHTDQHTAELAPFQVDQFSGSWHTRSFGRCVDFNLMHQEGWQGSLSSQPLPGTAHCPSGSFTGLYALSCSKITLRQGDLPPTTISLNKGDFLAVYTEADDLSVEITMAVAEQPAAPMILATCTPAGEKGPPEN